MSVKLATEVGKVGAGRAKSDQHGTDEGVASLGEELRSLRSAQSKSARLSTLTEQHCGVASKPSQRTDAWRLALPLKVGTPMVRAALARAAAMMAVKCMVSLEG